MVSFLWDPNRLIPKNNHKSSPQKFSSAFFSEHEITNNSKTDPPLQILHTKKTCLSQERRGKERKGG